MRVGSFFISVLIVFLFSCKSFMPNPDLPNEWDARRLIRKHYDMQNGFDSIKNWVPNKIVVDSVKFVNNGLIKIYGNVEGYLLYFPISSGQKDSTVYFDNNVELLLTGEGKKWNEMNFETFP